MADVPRQLELTVGATWTLELEPAGGGYRWHAHVDGDEGIVAATTDYAEGVVAPGGWRGDAVTVTALCPGSADVLIDRRRSWETSGAGGGRMMRVTVRPASRVDRSGRGGHD